MGNCAREFPLGHAVRGAAQNLLSAAELYDGAGGTVAAKSGEKSFGATALRT